MTLREISEHWRTEADILRHWGAVIQADAVERCAEDLEIAEKEFALEELTLEQAAADSGYSYSALQRMVADRRIPNAGDKHKPRVRRADLPRKAGRINAGEGETDNGKQD